MYINEKKRKTAKYNLQDNNNINKYIYMYTEKGKQKDKNRMQSY